MCFEKSFGRKSDYDDNKGRLGRLGNNARRYVYSIPWAKIMMRPGSAIISSLTIMLSQGNTMTACLPGTRLQLYRS